MNQHVNLLVEDVDALFGELAEGIGDGGVAFGLGGLHLVGQGDEAVVNLVLPLGGWDDDRQLFDKLPIG